MHCVTQPVGHQVNPSDTERTIVVERQSRKWGGGKWKEHVEEGKVDYGAEEAKCIERGMKWWKREEETIQEEGTVAFLLRQTALRHILGASSLGFLVVGFSNGPLSAVPFLGHPSARLSLAAAPTFHPPLQCLHQEILPGSTYTSISHLCHAPLAFSHLSIF
jgi:hypothetical protein